MTSMRILYATDGSKGSAAAGQLLSTLGLDTDSTITIVTVDDGHHDAEITLDAGVRSAGATSATVKRMVRRGHPAGEIIRGADEVAADLIVLGTHGRTAIARFLLGSTAERVARSASCPVLLVRGSGEPLRRVMLGVDGSESASAAASWMHTFPLPEECDVRLVSILANLREISREHVLLTPPFTKSTVPLDAWQRENAAERLAEVAAAFANGKLPMTEIRSGDAVAGLLEAASDEGADLIVVGSHGTGSMERFLLGSVSQQVLCHAPCSVLIVRGHPACWKCGRKVS
jgi:nucleotide-binding universal stress UspA family protein